MLHSTPIATFCISALTMLNACGLGSTGSTAGSSAMDTSTAIISSQGSSAPIPVETVDVATDLQAPWSVAFHGSTPLVSERDTARILEVTADGDTRVVATIDDAQPQGEGDRKSVV